jgi:PHP-associated
MISLRNLSLCLLGTAFVAGTIADAPNTHGTISAHGYRVLTADLHVHTFPLSASTLPPWDVAIEAGRQGLDVIALSGHNNVLEGKVGHWFARRFGGPIVLESEEIHGPRFHMIAAGIHDSISWRLTASQAIDEVHRQGGVAIAAHPTESSWPAYAENGAIDKLDGTEVLQPAAYAGEGLARQLREFYARTHAAPIASSDYHGMGPLGLCRTVLFVREASEQGVLEAIRAHRTLVFDGDQTYADPAILNLLDARTIRVLTAPPNRTPFQMLLCFISSIYGVLGVLCLILAVRTTKAPF